VAEAEQTTSAIVLAEGDAQVGLRELVANQSWSPEPTVANLQEFRFIEQRPTWELPLAVETVDARQGQAVVVERAWAQTWLTGERRQDRVVFLVRSKGGPVVLTLPAESNRRGIEVLVNGQPAAQQRLNERIELHLPGDQDQRRSTIELRWQSDFPLSGWQRVGLAWPRIRSSGFPPRTFWMLVTPPDFLACDASPRLFPEYSVGWRNGRWGRQPTQDQRQLEDWAGVSTLPAPPDSAGQYVYSSFGPPSTSDVRIVRTMWAVSAASLVAFAVGIVCMKFAWGRGGSFWLAVSLALAAILALRPEIAIVGLQALVVGGLLTLLAAALKRALLGPDGLLPPAEHSSGSTVDYSAATQAWSANEIEVAEGDPSPAVASSGSTGIPLTDSSAR
ncbi:MAG: hypothetical protein AAF961_06670, partial [Planctomycetota bacterium]